MKRNNCNLKLELQPPVSDPGSSTEQQKLTIFYDGQVCVCDVSEFQARAILLLASRDLNMEEKMKSPAASSNSSGGGGDTANYGPAVSSPSPTTAAATGLSMQRSLQRFLQKRKHRSHVATPHPYQR